MSSENIIFIEEGFWVMIHQDETGVSHRIERTFDSSYIQFHFCFKGAINFHYNKGNYVVPLSDEHVLLLYNPQRNLPLQAHLSGGTKMISVFISIQKLHKLFSQESDQIHFLNETNIDKKYYKDQVISPSMAVVLSQMFQYAPNAIMGRLYLKAKVYELLSLYFDPIEANDFEQCPFLVDKENVRKIRNAKKIILERMAEPPTLSELADEIGLSLKKLKEGFKQLYGSSVFQFLLDHKMEVARIMLSSGTYNVNEVGLRLGYSTASHFINAFKKKFGTTPKKYLMSLSS